MKLGTYKNDKRNSLIIHSGGGNCRKSITPTGESEKLLCRMFKLVVCLSVLGLVACYDFKDSFYSEYDCVDLSTNIN